MDSTSELDYTIWLNKWASIQRLHPVYRYAGPWDAPIVVVGQREKGAILPFYVKFGTEFAYGCLGTQAFSHGWTYAQEVPPQHLRTKNGIISCGDKAHKWVRYHVDGDVPVLELPTPRYLLTRQKGTEIADVYNSVREFVENYTKEGK